MAMRAMKATMQDTKVRKPTALSALPQLRSYFRSCDPCIKLRTTDVTVVYFDCSIVEAEPEEGDEGSESYESNESNQDGNEGQESNDSNESSQEDNEGQEVMA